MRRIQPKCLPGRGGKHVLYGSTLNITLAAATWTWAAGTDTPVRDLTCTAVR
jgi:hypothetical protein